MGISIWAAFVAGILSFLAPCILPLIPVYVGYMAENSYSVQKTMVRTLFFIIGFSAVFVSFGALAGRFGFFTLRELPWLTSVAGVAVMFLGLAMLVSVFRGRVGYFSIPMLKNLQGFGVRAAEKAYSKKGNKNSFWLTPLVMGVALAIAWTPCIGPVLGGILTLAYARETTVEGSFLLFVYSIGLGIPFMLSAVFSKHILSIRKINKYSPLIQAFSGIMLVVFGVIIATNKLTIINGVLYDIWPF